MPFYQYADLTILGKVLRGDRPGRPQGAEGVWFTDDVWEVVNRCWASQPGNRPSIEDVLQCLEKVSTSWIQPTSRLLAVPSTASLLTRGSSAIITAESTDGSGVSSPPPVPLSQPPEELDPERYLGIVNRVCWTGLPGGFYHDVNLVFH